MRAVLTCHPALLEWGGPKDRVTQRCSVVTCRAPFDEDDVPLRMWKPDGSAIALCDACVGQHVRMEK